MPRILPLEPDQTGPQAQELLESLQAKLGMVPNLYRTMAHSPAALAGWVGLYGALSKGALGARFREQLALVVAEENDCDYCLSAHTVAGRMMKLSDDKMSQSRQAHAAETQTAAGLRFAQLLVRGRGAVTDADFVAVREAGYSDAQITEIIATVALNVFSNYFSIAADTDIDFPHVSASGG
jgi:uncharacterized peroxidase-related enzyme